VVEVLRDFDSLAVALQKAFPDIDQVSPLLLLGSGFGSLVVETPDGVVFRIARTAQAGAQFGRELRLLPVLEGLPVAVPRPEWYIPASDDFPHGLMGYRKLPGELLVPQLLSNSGLESLAVQIAEIILALQRVPLAPLLDFDLPTPWAGCARLRSVVLPALKVELRKDEYQKVASWWEMFLADARMREYNPVFQHGDLWYGNLLVEGNRVVGLVDFQEAGIGDPAQDFVPQLYLGKAFLRPVMAAFQRAGGAFDHGFEHRLTGLWALREFGGLAYSIEQDDREERIESVEKIRKGPILSQFGLDGWGDH